MSKVKDYFNLVAQNYLKRSNRPIWKWLRRREVRGIGCLIEKEPLKDVLDLGSGSGYYSRYLKELGCENLVCVDFSKKMLEQNDTPHCSKIEADIQSYVSPKKFDLILCAGVLEFLSWPENIFINANKMLKSAGKLVLLVPRKNVFGWAHQTLYRMRGIQVSFFSLEEINRWARDSNLQYVAHKEVALFSLVIKFSK